MKIRYFNKILHKNNATFLILAFSIILRFVNLVYRFPFSGEVGDNLLEIKDYVLSGKIPLLGPPTSHPWLFFGPYYYWIMVPVLRLFRFNPMAVSYIGAFLGVVIVFVNFVVVRRIIGVRVALLSSLVISLSPLFILFSQDSRFYYFSVLFLYFVLYLLYLFWKDNVKTFFWLGVSFGLMLSFHYSSLLLIPALIIIFYQKRKRIRAISYLKLILGLVLANTPFLIADLKNNFSMTRQFLLWIPYRILGFLGVIDKNNFTSGTILTSVDSFIQLLGETFTSQIYYWVPVSILVVFIVFLVIRKKIIKVSEFPWNFMLLSLIFSLIGIIIHGGAPLHYLLPVFPIPAILISVFILKYLRENIAYIGVFVLLLFLNFGFYKNILFERRDYVSINLNFISISIQKNIANSIAGDAQGKSYQLARVGPYDYFRNGYAQNYIYLLWLLGNQPEDSAGIKYTIYEDTSKIPLRNNENIIWVDGIAIVKS